VKTKTGRYSSYIRPFTIILDLIILNGSFITLSGFSSNTIWHLILMCFAWLIIASYLGFYEVYRYTKVISIFNCTFKQSLIFTLLCFFYAYFFYKKIKFKEIVLFISGVVVLLLFFKLSIYYFLKKYRILFGGNFRRVVLLGSSKSIDPLKHFFTENPDYGYQLVQTFEFNVAENNNINQSLVFILENKIDELYCSMDDLTLNQIKEIVYFADNNFKTLKFIPDEKQLLSPNAVFEYYDYIPIVSFRNILLDDRLNKRIKRGFDILFSTLIIVGILSWLTPILAILIKLDSKGPLFFIQKRNGLNYIEFNCYKYRSMEVNEQADSIQAAKNDNRITKIGKFMRKTSIDELPQFFNVLNGDMSVVGPRPHMVSHTEMYALKIDKFMIRHFIKPGITGLAQTKGFRGEIGSESDIINRVKYDIFYMKNWSILLDMKIIIITILNVIKGEEKAY
jgi:putative colanic acid biosynthesis UDP-glucose lipid carrier transferase